MDENVAAREVAADAWSWEYADTYAFMERVRTGMPPAMICVACNGGIQGKEANPALPETADEIADSVYEAYVAGASMVHVHARDRGNQTKGATTPEEWYEVNSKIRDRCPDIIINNTTGGDPVMSMQERLSALQAKPEVASLNLTPEMARFTIKERPATLLNPHPEMVHDYCLAFTYELIDQFAGEMKKYDVKPEMETYHSGGASVIRYLTEAGLVHPPYLIQTVMGTQTASYPTPDNVIQLLRELPDQTIWLCSGIGPFQLPMTTLAALMGGHLRVGLEDNIYYARGRKLKSNAESVERAVRIVHELNREVATPAQARLMLGLSANPTGY